MEEYLGNRKLIQFYGSCSLNVLTNVLWPTLDYGAIIFVTMKLFRSSRYVYNYLKIHIYFSKTWSFSYQPILMTGYTQYLWYRIKSLGMKAVVPNYSWTGLAKLLPAHQNSTISGNLYMQQDVVMTKTRLLQWYRIQ